MMTTPSDGLTLVRDRQVQAAIVLDPQPTRAAQFAAAELQHHLEAITGARLPVVTNVTDAVGVRVFVGDSAGARALGLKNEAFAHQEYLVGFRPAALVLMGRDKDDRGPFDYADANTFPRGFDEQGTCYAVYDFLETFCGVRWYLPTELGLVYQPTSTLTVAGADIRRTPFMWHRLLYKEISIPADLCGDLLDAAAGRPTPTLDKREALLFARRNRLGGKPFWSNHSLYGYYDRFLKTHPEWFAQGYAGKPPQMCYTATGLIAQVAQDARDYFDGRELVQSRQSREERTPCDSFAVVPMDNENYCKCAACRALLKAEPERGAGAFTDRASDYMFSFVNKVAREVGRTHPGKWITTAAYLSYAFPPTREPLEANVTLSFALYTRHVFNRQRQENNRRMLESWNAHAPQITKFAWMYFCYPALDGSGQGYYCFPGFFGTALVNRLKEYVRFGIRGLFIEPSYLSGEVRSVLMDQLELYLTWKLADNPELDGQALMDEFFERYYGAAAKPMKTLYQDMEQVYGDTSIRYPDEGVQTEDMAWGHLGTKKRMRDYGRLMAEAQTLAQTDLEKRRVALFDKGIWQSMLSGQQTYLKTVAVRRATAHKSVRVPRIVAGPAAGDPDQLDWSQAGRLKDWLTDRGETSACSVEGLVMHDGRFLFVRLTATGDPKSLVVENDNSWRTDGWLLYVARQREAPYRQLLAGQNGDIVARQLDERITDWDTKAVVRTRNEPGRRVLTLALPLADLLPDGVKPGETLYGNIIRASPDKQRLAWIPTFSGGRDAPSRFGEIRLDP